MESSPSLEWITLFLIIAFLCADNWAVYGDYYIILGTDEFYDSEKL